MTSTKAPKLRFKEFGGYWQEKKLGGIISDHKESTKTQDEYPVMTSSRNGIVLQKDYYGGANRLSARSNIGYNILPKRYITYRSRSDDGLFVFNMNNTGKKGIVSYFYPVFTTISSNNNPYFLLTLLNQNWQLFYKYSVGTSQRVLSHSELKKIKLSVPDFEEQQKIAKFLIGVDERIELQDKKVKLLEKYKKGIMQKIFSQQIRFKDKDSKGYPDWQEKKLGEIGKTYNGLVGKAGEDFGEGEPFITYKQIFDNQIIDSKKFAYVRINKNEKQNTVKYGDIFFTTSSETPLEVGFASVLLENIPQLYLNSFCFGYRIEEQELFIPQFAIYLFRSLYFRRLAVKLAQGSTRFNMSKLELMKVSINLPIEEEQQKIAEFLTSIDDKVELERDKLKQAKLFKKALLQRMFV